MPRTRRRITPPDPAKMTDAALADALLTIKAVIAPLTTREAAMKNEAKKRLRKRGVSALVGRQARVTASTVTRLVLDMAAATKKLGATWCKKHSRDSTSVRINVRALTRTP